MDLSIHVPRLDELLRFYHSTGFYIKVEIFMFEAFDMYRQDKVSDTPFVHKNQKNTDDWERDLSKETDQEEEPVRDCCCVKDS